jgi:RNA polymerase sigma-70 factor (ECF subfamily)
VTETSLSLLDTLRNSADEAAWTRLVELYSPLIHGWLRRQGMQQDAEDVTQDVLTVVVRRLSEFERAPRTGAFRAWLRTITVNCLRAHWRRQKNKPIAGGRDSVAELINQLEDPASHVSKLWDAEHDRHVTRYLLESIKPRFSEQTWKAFTRVALDEAKAQDVAAELGMSENAVFIAKSRVLSALRQQGCGLIDLSERI